MTKPEETLRHVIDDTVLPRLQDYHAYLAAAGPHPIPVGRADLLYVWDEYRTEYLDWATQAHPFGHAHPIVTASQISDSGSDSGSLIAWSTMVNSESTHMTIHR